MASSRIPAVLALILVIGAPAIAEGCRPSRRTAPASEPAAATSAPAAPAAPAAARAPGESAGGVSLAAIDAPIRRDALLLATRREHALDRLLRRGESATPAMVALLASKNLDEVRSALEWFIAIHPEPGTGELAALLTHPSEPLRGLAIDALVAKNAQGQASAVAGLLGDPSPVVRAKAADALRQFGDASATEALIARVQDPDPIVALAAAHAAAAVGGADAWKSLLAEARGGTPGARRAALYGLRRMEQPVPLELLDQALASPELDLRLEGIKGLRLAVEDAAPARLGLQLGDAQPEVRRVALETVFATDAKAGVTAARGKLDDPSPEVRAAALALLVADERGGLTGAELARYLADPLPGVRAVAAASAGARSGPELRDALVARLSAESELPIRRLVVRALGSVGDRSTVDALIAAMEEPRGPLLDEAVESLQRITGEKIGADPAAWREATSKPAGEPAAAPDTP
ncbi:MAG: HEAT repeat domain-containing protein [Deltaproteobacteria bacterium]|nr:HEAT repeat domain-containing protein [Deltaproteobacteria bacterium]MCB9788712.1 HEAT repeat domain-containing protein [Deltaproteobacteria bacterium]